MLNQECPMLKSMRLSIEHRTLRIYLKRLLTSSQLTTFHHAPM
jgi:hypothetical protein